MTISDKTMGWLDHNRHRSFPMQRDLWREKVSSESGLDSVLVDARVFDSDAKGDERLLIESITVSSDSTDVVMCYGKRRFNVTLHGGDVSGSGSFEFKRGVILGSGLRGATVSLVFSSHKFILEAVGEGSWNIGVPVISSRVMSLSSAGVDGISVNGSSGVDGHDTPSVASGDVVLEDGYQTSPIVWGGRVLVRVGKRYGTKPCKYDFGDAGSRDCRRPLFFFCGQNAINSGNIVLRGGRGVNVSQGREYVVNDKNSKCDGKSIPCVEIVATRELLDIFRPSSMS